MTKLAFISDLPSNFDALTAVLKHLEEVGCDQILCLGDVVGYGPEPAQCVQEIQRREIPTVLGNHDEYVSAIMDPHVQELRQEVQDAISWTQAQLSWDELTWLGKLPFSMEADDEFTILHSSFAPGRWAYCLDERTFQNNFKGQQCQLAFCGHSHSPLYAWEETPGDTPFVDYIPGASRRRKVPTEGKVMVNVGSVGQPRDRDPRACVVFYELESRELWLDRVPYDMEAARQKILATKKLPARFGDRLLLGK